MEPRHVLDVVTFSRRSSVSSAIIDGDASKVVAGRRIRLYMSWSQLNEEGQRLQELSRSCDRAHRYGRRTDARDLRVTAAGGWFADL